jgi:trehalose 6-phosphate phosphatase
MLARGRMLVCLDYDGTISAITADPYAAHPVPGAREALKTCSAHPDSVTLAIVSGRAIDQVKRLLGLESGILFAGVHGLELLTPDGRRVVADKAQAAAADIERVREWLARTIARDEGFVVEDKRVAIALHYRNSPADRAGAVRDALRRFVADETSTLRILHGNRVDEVLPREAGDKGSAVRYIRQSVPVPDDQVAYFGDDVTDEDAFGALGAGSLTVLVGPPRPTRARYRVDGPDAVVRELADLADAVSASARRAGNRPAR